MHSQWIRMAGLLWMAAHAAGVPAQQGLVQQGLAQQGSAPAEWTWMQPAVEPLPQEVPPGESASATANARLLSRLEAVETELAAMRAAELGIGSSDFGAAAGPADSAGFCPSCNLTGCSGGCPSAVAPPPEYPTVDVTGFFQLDWGFFQQDPVNRATLGDIDDGLGFRRARLAASGSVTENTRYIMEFDAAQGQARFVDVWMEFQKTPLGNLRIGRFRQPFGMSELTSIREIPFLERPLLFALSPFRQTGAMLHDTAFDQSVTWAVSGYRYLSDNFGNTFADDGGYGMASRITGLLVDRGDDGLLHLGADYSYNDPGRDQVQYVSTNSFFVGQNPLLGPSGLSVLPIVAVPLFVDTGVIPTEQTNLYNVEIAYGRRNFLVQSEARWSRLQQLDGATNTFPGVYAHVRYVLTGETIPYNRGGGVFGRLTPRHPVNLRRGGWGAWEVAVRGSYLDLNGQNLAGPGRRLTNSIVGLNWYVNNFTKFQFNWIRSNLDDPTLGDSDAGVYALRGQIDF